jgi:hypothetical protein
VALKHNQVVVELASRLKERGVKGKALIGAAMHKLAHLRAKSWDSSKRRKRRMLVSSGTVSLSAKPTKLR